ncbi:hypothetical protein [Vibrio harveyi]|uniref:hypothetical protein n=1 Tax=Vibrio harveyi TaxID=669 RepID=UPI003CED0792
MSKLNSHLESARAFHNGVSIAKSGGSIHLNPYRNKDSSFSYLFEAWVMGWCSIKPNFEFSFTINLLDEIGSNPELIEAFDNGAHCFESGMSIHANKYRNMDGTWAKHELAWESGWYAASLTKA